MTFGIHGDIFVSVIPVMLVVKTNSMSKFMDCCTERDTAITQTNDLLSLKAKQYSPNEG